MERRSGRHAKKAFRACWEDLALSVVIAVLSVLIVIQSVLITFPFTGRYLNTALRLEGEPIEKEDAALYTGSAAGTPWASVTLRITGSTRLPEATVFVNGREAASFQKYEITLNVKDRDQITVKNSDPEQIITVLIDKATPNVKRPVKSSSVSGKGMVFLDPVMIE